MLGGLFLCFGICGSEIYFFKVFTISLFKKISRIFSCFLVGDTEMQVPALLGLPWSLWGGVALSAENILCNLWRWAPFTTWSLQPWLTTPMDWKVMALLTLCSWWHPSVARSHGTTALSELTQLSLADYAMMGGGTGGQREGSHIHSCTLPPGFSCNEYVWV